jgi:hypothetical protein
MFVVRHSSLDGGQKFKAFTKRPDAESWFKAGCKMVANGDLAGVAWFRVTGNAREAVEAVKAGKADLVAIDGRAELEQRTSKFVDRLVAEGQASKRKKNRNP